MKKLLLSLLAVAGLSFAASADTYTIQFKANPTSNNQGAIINDQTDITSVVESGADFVASFSDFSQAYEACNYGLKIGANKQAGKITVNLSDAGKVNASKIEVYASASNNATFQKLSVNGTEFSFASTEVNGEFKVCEITPNGMIDALVFEKTNASTASKEQGFIFVNKVVVTYTTSGETKTPAGLSYTTTKYTVEHGDAFTAPELTNPNSLTVAYSSSDPEVATVNATTGAVEIVGVGTTTITAKSEETDIYYAGSASYTITVTAPVQTIASIAATKELASETEFKVGYELTVAFKNYSNVFACDAAGDFIQIYGSNSYNIGDKIPAGWTGEYVLYNGNTPEIKPVGNLPEGEAGTFTPAVVSATAISTELVNSVVTINNVELAEATPDENVTDTNAKNFTGTVDGTTLNFRNNYKLASVEAGTYNITVVVTVYQNEPSLYVTNFEKVTPTGINGIFVEENAPVEYYNLQGVRVANPENGLYIRRQGNKATKVLVK